jgi:Isochorismatase family
VSRVARAQDGYISSLIRARSRARHPDDGGGSAMASQTTDQATTALLVMDVQNGIVGRFGDAVLEPIGRAIAAARETGVPVVYVRVGFRPGAPEVSPRNRVFRAVRDAGA